jgi:hypothetical protein
MDGTAHPLTRAQSEPLLGMTPFPLRSPPHSDGPLQARPTPKAPMDVKRREARELDTHQGAFGVEDSRAIEVKTER